MKFTFTVHPFRDPSTMRFYERRLNNLTQIITSENRQNYPILHIIGSSRTVRVRRNSIEGKERVRLWDGNIEKVIKDK
jgi:hypothetical protein